ncbi:hypothetical protein [Cytobacillus massiliigabonensis]|uniref:hypothetical protein n=1 Tax=Cytobacillus massiliigabonensis TaxID=1871011 RepID=UPI0015E12875|nr:hypothetical protein [Cytobacillus massiliigabonensis]
MINIKVRNFYYLIVGVLAILFAVTHAWNGQYVVLVTNDIMAMSMDNRTVLTYVWHIITAENLVFGIAFIFMSFQSEQSKVRFTAWMIVTILVVRLMVILGVTAILDVSALTDTLLDSIAIVIYVALIILGTTKKNKQSAG